MAKISIVGANGFLGSHLVDSLVQDGHTVTAFDRFSNGQRRFNVEPDSVIVGDFLNSDDLRKAVESQDYVIHLLSLTNPAIAAHSSTFDLEFNVQQSVRLVEIAAKAGVEHFFFASSGGTIYGDQGLEKYAETDATFPISPYGIGKLTVENYLRYFEVVFGLKSTTFRISNPYGPRQNTARGQGLIPITLERLEKGLPALMFGDGTMKRDYIFIDDLIMDMNSLISSPTTSHSVFNLGSGIGYSINDIFDTIRMVLGEPFEIDRQSKPMTFVEKVVLDITRLDMELGPRSRTPLELGIARTLNSMRQ